MVQTTCINPRTETHPRPPLKSSKKPTMIEVEQQTFNISNTMSYDGCGGCGCVPQDSVGRLHQSGSAVGRDTLGGAGSEIGERRAAFDDETVKTIGEDMAKLSVSERNDVFEEIHGVDEIIEERPDFVDDQISKMKEEISKIVHKEAYNKAFLLAPTRVHNKNFLLMFLRSTKFNSKAAAAKIVCYFDWKYKLFGAEKVSCWLNRSVVVGWLIDFYLC